MISLSYIPQHPLSNFARLFWYYSGFRQPHAKERLLPDGTVSLVVNLRDDRVRMFDSRDHRKAETIDGHVLSGPRAGYFVIDTLNMVDTIGVHFHPGGAFPFFRMPASELRDQSLSLDQLWGTNGPDLRVRLLSVRTPQEKFRVLELWLLERLAKPLDRHPAVAYALAQFQLPGESLSVAAVVSKIGMSQRHFIQLFAAQVGLTPKVFSRVIRFQQAVRSISAASTVDWSQIALDCGYYDQAHFIHDFQEFSGITPASYLVSGPRYLNHVPLLD